MPINCVRIVGDVHGKYEQYTRIIGEASGRNVEYSIQIGDMGYNYSPLKEFDHHKHKFFKGNHDNYGMTDPHDLGDYGEIRFSRKKLPHTYFIRGAFSIDWRIRVDKEVRGIWPKTYFKNEQLSDEEMDKCIVDYTWKRPKIVLTHTAPKSIMDKIGNPAVLERWGFNADTFTTRTQEFLEQCFNAHQPELWIFGHMHRNWTYHYEGTTFVCLGELAYMDLEI